MVDLETNNIGNHPVFPQESPAIQYIVGQVAMMQDAASCSRGYYKSHEKLLQRVNRTDVELDELKTLIKCLDAHIQLLSGHTDTRKVAESFKLALDEAISDISSNTRNEAKTILIKQTHNISESAKNMGIIVDKINRGLSLLEKENISTRISIENVCQNTLSAQNTFMNCFNERIDAIISKQETILERTFTIQEIFDKNLHISKGVLFGIVLISIIAGIAFGSIIGI